MHQLDQKKLLIERILPYLIGGPADVVQRLLQQSVSDLEAILEDAITKKARAEAAEQVKQHADQMRHESQLEGAWTHALRNVWNGKQRLVECDSNRAMMESLLQPHETPSAAIYSTIALSYPTKFSWEVPLSGENRHGSRESEFRSGVLYENLLEPVRRQLPDVQGRSQYWRTSRGSIRTRTRPVRQRAGAGPPDVPHQNGDPE